MPNSPSKAKTNTTPQSKKNESLNIITFAKLKAAYPSSPPCDTEAFPDQCAIKVSTALRGAGASLKSFKGVCCWQPEHKGMKHVLRAEELANWLKKRYLANWPNPVDITGKDWQTKIENKTGVIFFKDYWLRKGEKFPSGDHIDLWDKDELTSGGIAGILRFWLGIDTLDVSWIHEKFVYSNLGDSKQISFWEIK